MVAAQLFNERAGRTGPVLGCVTTGEDWQFLRLDATTVTVDRARRYVSDVASVLAAFVACLAEQQPPSLAAPALPPVGS
jgi:hypothetical protein